jgi:hypothetical protein
MGLSSGAAFAVAMADSTRPLAGLSIPSASRSPRV